MRLQNGPRSRGNIADKVSVKKARDEEPKFKGKNVKRRARLETSSSEDETPTAKPDPVEYLPFDAKNKCHSLTHFISTYERHPEKADLDVDNLVGLQHELEAMASHAADFARHVQREIAFIQRGVYPLKDLSQQPMPIFHYKSNSIEYSDDEIDLFAAAPVVPKEPEDKLDDWPPEHVAKRFWTWCKHDFLKPIDADFLSEYSSTFVEPFNEESCSKMLINEPWRYRTRSKKEATKSKKHAKLNRRRSSLASQNGYKDSKKEEDDEHEESPNKRRLSCTATENSRQLVTNVLKAYAEECKMIGEFNEEKLKVYVNRRKSSSSEDLPTTFEMISPKTNGNHSNGHSNGNGSSNGFVNGGLDSSESEGENDEPTTLSKWSHNGDGNSGQRCDKGQMNGSRIMKRRDTMEECVQEIEAETVKETGRSIIAHLTQLGVTQKEAPEIFDMSLRAAGISCDDEEPRVGQKGRRDGEPMDEISVRLMLAQKQLVEAVSEYRKTSNETYEILESEFVYRELKKDLDKADDELIRLGSMCYREPPLPRRVANQTDMAFLKPAVKARNRAASLLYGSTYREVHWQHVERLKPKNRPLRDLLSLTSPKPSVSRVPKGDTYEITDQDYSLPSKNPEDDELNDSMKTSTKKGPRKVIESESESDEEVDEVPIKMEVDEDETYLEEEEMTPRSSRRHKKAPSPKRNTSSTKNTPRTHLRRR
ncbi:unnamed protein product, partial [Mesorhabditis belari]|uniref:Uncharacterized protein n=1 Tax=Mesorhabditis belari TaxID=2138241 RepID=A0AAF3FI63_9BILA